MILENCISLLPALQLYPVALVSTSTAKKPLSVEMLLKSVEQCQILFSPLLSSTLDAFAHTEVLILKM